MIILIQDLLNKLLESTLEKMRIAIIDIGSNAVRSVVYSDNSINAYEIYHERFKIDLNGIFATEDLSVKHPFYVIIHRFIDIFQKLDVKEIKCVATAILRDNPQAAEFSKLFYEKYKINIEIISGEQEAFLSSCGLLMGSPNPHGIIADLGGGSLEIAEVQSHKINRLTSLPLGTQILSKIDHIDLDYIISKIRTAYANPVKSKLYLIGGGFRVIAKAYIKRTNYPLYNLHNLEINAKDCSNYLTEIQENYKSVFGNTRKNDRFAVIVLQGLIEVFQPSKILISNYGLKEGVRFITLPSEERYKDLIFERCKDYVQYIEGSIDLDGYTALIQQILGSDKEDADEVNDIIKISLMFIHFKKHVDRNFFGHFLSHTVLMADIPFTHTQRASLALILSNAFGNKPNNYVYQLASTVLNKEDYRTASLIAKMINIFLILDGPNLMNKCSFTIETENDKPVIKTSQTLPYNLFHYVNKQLKSLHKISTSQVSS
jgi:exopolyphosphatase/guanosine-5'-triphosphate,3'-diphosphate pyrophosphatase